MRTYLESVNLNSNYDLNTLAGPVVVYFKVTGCCNLKCTFCSQAEGKKINMGLTDAKTLLAELKKIGVVSINYTGGEPLVYKDILELVKYGNQLGFEQTLVTNAISLFKKKEVLNYINTIGISLHGMPKTHDKLCNMNGAFKIVKENISRLLKEYPKINVNVNYTLTKENIDDKNLDFVRDFCKKRNIKLCFGRLNYLGFAEKEDIINPNIYLEKISKLKDEYSSISISNCISSCMVDDKFKHLNHACGAGVTIFSVEANGDVKICPSSNYILGNAFSGDFKKIINNNLIKKYKRLDWLPNSCRICKDFSYCKGGCHSEGNGEFYNNSCDALLINKLSNIWNNISYNKIMLKCGTLRKENNKYLIVKVPLRKIDKIGYKILLKCDGSMTGSELVKYFNNIENIKDFLCTLYIDGIVGVVNAKEND